MEHLADAIAQYDIDETKITAEFKDGILKVELPKTAVEVQQIKQIPIK